MAITWSMFSPSRRRDRATSGQIFVRRKWSGQDVPSAASSSQALRADEFQHRIGIVEVPDLRLVLADQAADRGHQLRRDRAAPLGRKRLDRLAAEDRLAGRLALEPGDGAVDDVERQLVAGLGVVGPGEEAVAFEHAALRLRILAREFFQPQPKLEAGPLPRQPADLVAINFLGELARILRCGDGDHRVGVHMVDMLVGQEGVQRRVDRSGARIEVEGRVRQQLHHLVFVRDAAIEAASCALSLSM